MMFFFFFSSRRRHTRWNCDWSSDVCSSDLAAALGQQLIVGGEARLGLGLTGARRHPDPFQLALERPLAGAVLLLLLRQPLLLLLEPRGVVALPGDAGAAVELEDPARHVVEEVAIVGDGDDGARVLLEKA